MQVRNFPFPDTVCGITADFNVGRPCLRAKPELSGTGRLTTENSGVAPGTGKRRVTFSAPSLLPDPSRRRYRRCLPGDTSTGNRGDDPDHYPVRRGFYQGSGMVHLLREEFPEGVGVRHLFPGIYSLNHERCAAFGRDDGAGEIRIAGEPVGCVAVVL